MDDDEELERILREELGDDLPAPDDDGGLSPFDDPDDLEEWR